MGTARQVPPLPRSETYVPTVCTAARDRVQQVLVGKTSPKGFGWAKGSPWQLPAHQALSEVPVLQAQCGPPPCRSLLCPPPPKDRAQLQTLKATCASSGGCQGEAGSLRSLRQSHLGPPYPQDHTALTAGLRCPRAPDSALATECHLGRWSWSLSQVYKQRKVGGALGTPGRPR